MTRIALLGLGGGGGRFVGEAYRWLEGENHRKLTSNFGAWRFGNQHGEEKGAANVLLPDGVGLIILDVAAHDIDTALDVLGDDVLYRLADRTGFGGDRQLAFDTILRRQIELETDHENSEDQDLSETEEEYDDGPRKVGRRGGSPAPTTEQIDKAIPNDENPPGGHVPPLVEWMRQTGLGDTHVVLSIFSLDGGTGRGAFEFLLTRWEEFFDREDLSSACLAFVPPVSELLGREMARETVEYLQRLDHHLANGIVDYVFVASYDLAYGQFMSSGNTPLTDYYDDHRRDLRRALGRTGGALSEPLSRIGATPGGAMGSDAVDAGVIQAMAGILTNVTDPLLVSGDAGVGISDPKGLDVEDIRSYLKGLVVVPCYFEVSQSLAEFYNFHRGAHEWFVDRGFNVADNPMTMLTDFTLMSGSLIPFVNLVDNPQQELRGKVKSVVAVVWAAEGVTYGDTEPISRYLRSVLDADSRCFVRTGKSPLSNYTSSRMNAPLSEAVVKMWLYVGLNDSALIRDQVNRIAQSGF